VSLTERQIECEFFRVEVFNSATDNTFTLWIANASDDAYTVFDIGSQVRAWLKSQQIEGYITGIRESPKTGFCIVAD
jgi:hypothetical protein